MAKQVKGAGSVACSARERPRTPRCAVPHGLLALQPTGQCSTSTSAIGKSRGFPACQPSADAEGRCGDQAVGLAESRPARRELRAPAPRPLALRSSRSGATRSAPSSRLTVLFLVWPCTSPQLLDVDRAHVGRRPFAAQRAKPLAASRPRSASINTVVSSSSSATVTSLAAFAALRASLRPLPRRPDRGPTRGRCPRLRPAPPRSPPSVARPPARARPCAR